LASSDYDDAVKPSQANGSEHQADMSPPPAPPPQNNNFNGKEKQSVHTARADGDGIFVGDGVDYLVLKKEMSRSPVSVDTKRSYFTASCMAQCHHLNLLKPGNCR
jgi:IK cytokine